MIVRNCITIHVPGDVVWLVTKKYKNGQSGHQPLRVYVNIRVKNFPSVVKHGQKLKGWSNLILTTVSQAILE